MSRDPYRIAQARLVEIEAEARSLRVFIEMYEALAGRDAPTAAAPAPRSTTLEALAQAPLAALFTIEPPATKTADVLKAAEEILNENGKPMRASDIYEQLLARGVKIAGRSPKANLTAKFSTTTRLRYDPDVKLWFLSHWLNTTGQRANAEAGTV